MGQNSMDRSTRALDRTKPPAMYGPYGCPPPSGPAPSSGGAAEFDSDDGPPGLISTSGEDSESDLIQIGEVREFTKTNKGKPVLVKYMKLDYHSTYSRSRYCDSCGLGFVSQELLCDVKASGREIPRKKSKYPCWCSCKTAVYCSVLCQQLHWQQHKAVCPWRKWKRGGRGYEPQGRKETEAIGRESQL